MVHWLMKSEPESYSWDALVRDGGTEWDGVRNPAARLHLKAMQVGDEAFFYHSGADKACVGVMKITRTWKPDGPEDKWASVAVAPVAPLTSPVTLATIKTDPRLAKLEMVRQSRLSVSPVGEDEWKAILDLAGGVQRS
ncbi:ubiquinol-cytochrome c reductase [Sphingomonas sp. DBB INV C78]|uniref:EVE domain-containing protein n=1 Tax=Sphingomonas sp. DBB INV C78 TaxID=3349434 RepID=UPI0036D24755